MHRAGPRRSRGHWGAAGLWEVLEAPEGGCVTDTRRGHSLTRGPTWRVRERKTPDKAEGGLSPETKWRRCFKGERMGRRGVVRPRSGNRSAHCGTSQNHLSESSSHARTRPNPTYQPQGTQSIAGDREQPRGLGTVLSFKPHSSLPGRPPNTRAGSGPNRTPLLVPQPDLQTDNYKVNVRGAQGARPGLGRSCHTPASQRPRWKLRQFQLDFCLLQAKKSLIVVLSRETPKDAALDCCL